MKAAGNEFAIVRVSDGIKYPDDYFARNWAETKRAGLVRGLYQFFRPKVDINAQVDLLVSKLTAAGGLEPGDLPPVMDFEDNTSGLPASTVAARGKEWLIAVEQRLGVRPIIYTAVFMQNYLIDDFSDYVLQVANYGVSCPDLPRQWSNWALWQTTDKGRVSGITGDVDLDVFNGDFASLMALTVPAATLAHQPRAAESVESVDAQADLGSDHGAVMGAGARMMEHCGR